MLVEGARVLKGGSFHTLFMFLREDLAMTGVVTLTAEMR
jgi:hypothetical protein